MRVVKYGDRESCTGSRKAESRREQHAGNLRVKSRVRSQKSVGDDSIVLVRFLRAQSVCVPEGQSNRDSRRSEIESAKPSTDYKAKHTSRPPLCLQDLTKESGKVWKEANRPPHCDPHSLSVGSHYGGESGPLAQPRSLGKKKSCPLPSAWNHSKQYSHTLTKMLVSFSRR